MLYWGQLVEGTQKEYENARAEKESENQVYSQHSPYQNGG